jgi:hypothetical protein
MGWKSGDVDTRTRTVCRFLSRGIIISEAIVPVRKNRVQIRSLH